jgi:hypothetical protein
MNLAMVIAIYASISKELGLPLRFPGKPGAYDKLLEMTDASRKRRLGLRRMKHVPIRHSTLTMVISSVGMRFGRG